MKIKHAWLIVTIVTFLSNTGFAQQIAQPVLKLTKGDGYKITTYINTSTKLQHGNKTADLLSVASISKMYKVTDATDAGYQVTATITRITDTLNAFGKNVAYSSDRAPKADAQIEAGLSAMINKTTIIKFDKSGVITGVAAPGKTVLDDNVSILAGLPIDNPAAGNVASFLFNSNTPADAKVGTSWKFADKKGNDIVTVVYTITGMNAEQIMLTYTIIATQSIINTNTNASLVVDRASGIILRRSIKSESAGYKKVNDTRFTEWKKVNLEEVCELVK